MNVFDIRQLSSLDGSSPRRLATLSSAQKGQPSAVRKVKFSATEGGSEILAFTEHRSVIQVVSTLQYESPQIIIVPPSSPPNSPSGERPQLEYYHPPASQQYVAGPQGLSANAQGRPNMNSVLDHILRQAPESRARIAVLTLNDLAALQPNFHYSSAYFPDDHSTSDDLLGMDFDEWGETLFVATNQRVWGYRVDGDAQRRSETFSTR